MKMNKALFKATLFLAILTLLDFLFRKGLLAFFIPFKLPYNSNILILFSLFALCSWLVTKWFARTDNTTLDNLGISLNAKNRIEFYYGLIIGIVLWAIVSFAQSYLAGFSWELRSNASFFNVIYGLIFIFIADLGTELFTRGYPLRTFEKSVGAHAAIIIMMLFVGLKSYSSQVSGELLFYTLLIPVIHTVFFSIIYFKTGRIGGPLGVHTGANFVTISIFDLRVEQDTQAIPSGLFQSDVNIETLSLTAIQTPWIIVTVLFSIGIYIWWKKM